MARTAAKARKASPAQAQPMRILNCIPSRDVEKDWGFEHAAAAGMVAVQPLPKSRDLRENWWTIGDQGQTGSCVGWASADSLLRWHFTKAGRLAPDERLSVRFIWMAAKETDEFSSYPSTFIEPDGTSLKAALDIARKFGVVRESVLPFADSQLYPGDTKTFYSLCSQLKISSYHNLGRKLADWRKWLAFNGPILTRLDVDDTFMNAFDTQGRLQRYRPATARGGHAVSIVGYDGDGFIIRNSWATTWGDRGFAHASNDYAEDAFTEAYGITV